MIYPCERCDRLTRPTSWPKQRAPHTVTRATKTLCITCYARDAKQGIYHPSESSWEPDKRITGIVPCARCGIERTGGKKIRPLCRDCKAVLTKAEAERWAS